MRGGDSGGIKRDEVMLLFKFCYSIIGKTMGLVVAFSELEGLVDAQFFTVAEKIVKDRTVKLEEVNAFLH